MYIYVCIYIYIYILQRLRLTPVAGPIFCVKF